MPHKITSEFAVYPTRHFVQERMFSFKHIYQIAEPYHGGSYHHYKFRNDHGRLIAGYNLGDRKAPDKDRFEGMQAFEGKYPQIIQSRFIN